MKKSTLTLCVNVREAPFASCGRRGSLAFKEALAREIEERGLPIELQTIACLGKCEQGPNARLAPANRWFHRITDVRTLMTSLEEMHAAD